MTRIRKKVVVYDLEHNELPAIYGFEDQVPVKIFAGKCQIDFSEIYSYIEFLFEKRIGCIFSAIQYLILKK